MTITLRPAPPPDDTTVLIHMGAGVVETVVRAAIRNYGEYRAVTADGYGIFAVSLFAVAGDVTEADILAALPQHRFGRSTAGAVRGAGFDLLATSVLDADMPPAVTAIQAAHLDVVLPAPEDTRFLLTDPLDDEGLEAVAITHLTPHAERLVALFDPRHRK